MLILGPGLYIIIIIIIIYFIFFIIIIIDINHSPSVRVIPIESLIESTSTSSVNNCACPKTNTSAILGGVIGGLIGTALLSIASALLGWIWYHHWHRKNNKHKSYVNSTIFNLSK